MANQNQGRNGEAEFEALCTRAAVSAEDVVVNRAKDDQHGWDHILEVTPHQNNAQPADLRTGVISCFAQIKTTSGKKVETTIKLSNAVKAAKSPLPYFIFLFQYGVSEKPILYGKHIWKDEIRHYLKRARQAGDAPLHKKKVTVKFTSADRLKCNPVDWVLTVLTTCGGDAYTLEKRRYVDTVGYGTETNIAHFEIYPIESPDEIVKHELDLRPDLPVRNFKLIDTRFGIKKSVPLKGNTAGRVRFTRDKRSATLKLRSCKGNDEIELPGLAWIPRTIPWDHPESRTRVKAGHIDIVTGPGINNDHPPIHTIIDLDSPEERSFIDHVGLLALLNWGSLGPVSASVEDERGPLFDATLKFNAPLETWAEKSWVCAPYFLDILGRERCKKINISLPDFCRFMEDYFVLTAAQGSNPIHISGLSESEGAEFSKMVGYSYGQFGDWTFGAIHEFKVVSRSQEDEKFTVVLAKPKTICRDVYKRPLAQSVEHITRKFKGFLARQIVPVATFGNGDLFEWGKSYGSNETIEVHDPIKPT